eukprot:jgi/Chrpa1/21950/Chrysochromulina_OHIO_Genome00024385-RA
MVFTASSLPPSAPLQRPADSSKGESPGSSSFVRAGARSVTWLALPALENVTVVAWLGAL